ncbi:MAG: ABC transporter substrate-binding protein [Candidatus Paceibacterota bacterium]|jgi:peptide/nickel transport system substrate-binding protein
MQKIKRFFKEFKIPTKSELKKSIDTFSTKEKLIFSFITLGLLVSSLILLNRLNQYFMVEVPTTGGSISEGILGTPRFVNPVLAISDTDKDLTTLIYSGLMRKMPNGDIAEDLAEKYEVSKDSLIYTFTLKDKIYFHDNKPVTADDILFTINKIKDSNLKSPKRASWEGVEVEKVDDKTIKFILKQPYSAFLENTTIGILPSHIWKNITPEQFSFSDFNINAIGTGPYEIKKVSKKSSGLIDSYSLTSFKKFALGEPFIPKIVLSFYSNEKDLIKALNSGQIKNISAISPEKANENKDNYRIETTVLPRIFGLFFNQTEAPLFADKNIIKAIDKGIDKNRIIQEVLYGYGISIDGPVPRQMTDYSESENKNELNREESVKQAIDILTKDGWKLGGDGIMEKQIINKKKKEIKKLLFSISTSDAPELKKATDLIKENLAEIGISVEVKVFEIGNLNQDVIRPRKFESLFFGQIINHQSDLFAFWHSSQRDDPGLNITGYANSKVDKILEDAINTKNRTDMFEKYNQVEEELKKDAPAVFIYSPDFIYIVSKKLEGLNIDHLINPSDRFSNIYSWYTNTEKVWNIFVK